MYIPNSSKLIPTARFYCPIFNAFFFYCVIYPYYNPRNSLNHRNSFLKNNKTSLYLDDINLKKFRFAPLAYVTNIDDNSVSIINILTHSIIQTVLAGQSPVSIAMKHTSFCAFLAYIANAGDGSVSVMDTTTNRVINRISVGGNPYEIAITPDGSKAYVTATGANRSEISVINTTTNRVTARIKPPDTPSAGDATAGIAITSDGSKVYVGRRTKSQVLVIDTKTNTIIENINLNGDLNLEGIAITPDGSKVYVTSKNSNISVIDTSNYHVEKILINAATSGIAVTPNGCYLYVTAPEKNTVLVIDISTNKIITEIKVTSFPEKIALTSDGTLAYVTHNSNEISIITTSNNMLLTTIHSNFHTYGISIIPLYI